MKIIFSKRIGLFVILLFCVLVLSIIVYVEINKLVIEFGDSV